MVQYSPIFAFKMKKIGLTGSPWFSMQKQQSESRFFKSLEIIERDKNGASKPFLKKSDHVFDMR